jgi:hypothetical protein
MTRSVMPAHAGIHAFAMRQGGLSRRSSDRSMDG